MILYEGIWYCSIGQRDEKRTTSFGMLCQVKTPSDLIIKIYSHCLVKIDNESFSFMQDLAIFCTDGVLTIHIS